MGFSSHGSHVRLAVVTDQFLIFSGFDFNFTLESLGLAHDFWYANSWSGKVLPGTAGWFNQLRPMSPCDLAQLVRRFASVCRQSLRGDFTVPGLPGSSPMPTILQKQGTIPHFHRDKLDGGWPESEEKYSKICNCEDRIA